MGKLVLYLIVMAGVTYLIRAIPFVLFRKKVKSRFAKSFLEYIPYAVLSAMTVPAVFESTGNIYASIGGFATAIILSWKFSSLLVSALGAAVVAFVLGILI